MKPTYQVRINGKQFTATWNPETDTFEVDGAPFHRKEVEVLQRFIINAQVWEWYGDPDYAVGDENRGHYKAKGGEDFILWLSDAEAMYGEIEAKLQAKFNQFGRYMKYDFTGESLMPYSDPVELSLDGGEIVSTKGFNL